MTKGKNSVSSKLLAVLLVISILIGTIQPTVAKAVENTNTVGTIVTLVNGGEIKDDTVTFSGTKLTWSPKNEAIGRNVDGWWVGIQVHAPAGMDSEQLKNSKYKYANSTESKSFWTYKDSADDAESHNIQLWGVVNEEYLINAIANDKTVDYKYEFDWDGDGTYEQPITMSVDPDGIILVKDGVEVYPHYATVTPLTGGTVSGDATNLELVIDEATLNWSDVDESVGRHTAGWWVGMKVTAPVGYTAEELQKAYYNRKVTSSTSDTGWSGATKVEFWGAKDSADADAVHHIQMWMVINPSLIEKYQGLTRNISTSYEFDWNNDGNTDQTIKLTVVPSEKIVLNKVAPEFEVEDIDITYGTKPHKIVINEIKVGDGKYVFSIEGENNIGASVDENGVIEFTDSEAKVGSITVKVKKEADDTFSELEKTFKVNVFYHETTVNPAVDGQKVEGSAWYSSVVTIKAPDGYVISASGNKLTTSDWADFVTINTDGVIASKYVYLKSVADGFITDGIEIKNIKIDTAAPGNIQLAIGDADKTVWDKIKEVLSFGLFINTDQKLTVSAEDSTSGIKTIEYVEKSITEGETLKVEDLEKLTNWDILFTAAQEGVEGAEGQDVIAKGPNRNIVVIAKVTDYAGNVSYVTSDGMIFDTTKPVLNDNKYLLPEEEATATVQASGRPLFNTTTVPFDVKVTEETVDGVLQSGIQSITYEITAKDRVDDVEYAATESGTLYTWTEGTDLSTEYTGKITVDSGKFNYNYVDITVTVVDNAGNETTEKYEFAIDITEPTIELSYDNNKVVGTEGTDARGYFDSERTATVVYTERTENWEQNKANEVLAKTVATDVNGEFVEYSVVWTDKEGATSDEDTHTATIKFVDEVDYNVKTPAYTDEAGNEATFTVAEGTEYPYIFSIDKADQDDSTATIEFKEQSWVKKLLNTITFGALFTNADVEVTVKAEDDFAGIKEIKYLEKTYAEGKQKVEITEDTVKAYTGWKTVKTIDADKDLAETVAETITKETDKNVVIFVWVTDYAGYEKIYSSDGLIVDITNPTPALTDNKLVLPETEATATVPASGRPLFNTEEISFNVEVTEETVDGVLQSGSKSVTYEINAKDRADDTEYAVTESGTLYSWVAGTDLSTEYTGKITVDSTKFNYNYVDITVTVVDNAGNETTETYEFAIDITEPTIELSYDNNKVVGTEGADARGYFDSERTATVVYTERTENWNVTQANEVLAKTIAKDVKNEDVQYTINWTDKEGTTSDADTHTATIEFADGVHYNVETPAYTDAAGNEAILTVAEGTEYPYVFSIDMYDDADSEATIEFKDQSWVKKFLNTITFGALFSNEDVDVTVTVADDFAGIKEIKYLEKTYSENKQTVEITEDVVKAYTGWKAVKTFDADKDLEETITDTIKNEVDKDVVIFVWVTDYAGYERIYSSDGLIVDVTNPTPALNDNKLVLPETEATATVPASGRPLFNTTTVPFDVKVTEETVDGVLQSGIKSVTYEINAKDRADDTEYAATESGTLYSWIAGTDLSTEYTGKITVDSAKFNYNYVDIIVTVVDDAGNETTETYELAIDITDPTIELSYTNNKFVGTEGADGRGYFDAERTATVVYTERTENWNQSKANEVLAKTIAKDAKDQKVEYVIEWKDVDGATADEDTHIATIKFVDGVHYNVETPAYTDETGNEATLTVAEGTKYPYVFTIDMYDDADSEATIEFKEQSWIEKLLNTITFNKLFSNVNVDVTATVADDLAGIREIKYIEKSYAKSVETIEVTEEVVIGYEEWTTTEPITFNSDMDLEEIVEKTISNDKNKNVVIYVWVTDYAGHERIFSSDGLVIDITNPTPALENGKLVYPETEATATVPVSKRPLFNTVTVPFNVAVTESTIEGVLQSGIQSVTYEISAKDRADDEAYVATETGTLYTWSENEALKKEFTTQIIVDSAKFNYNYVDIAVTVVDNAGNETTETYELAIDITVPTIELSYTNNKFVGTEGAHGRGYFDAERTVAIVYTERTENWNQSKANEVLAKTIAKDAKGEKVEYIIEWTDVDGATADEDTHTAIIKFVDGVHYNVETPAYTDEAGNEATLTVAEGTKYPYVFSIDMYDDADSEATIEFKEQSWIEKFLNAITFGALFSNKNVDVTVTVADDLAGIREIKYLEKLYTEGKQDIAITEEEVIAYTGWETITFDTDQDLEEILERTIANNVNKNVVIFVVVTDYAGYQRVFSSDGLNMDIKNPTPTLENGKLVYPETKTEAAVPASDRPLYNTEEVVFNVAVTEETIKTVIAAATGETPEVVELVLQSGIKSVTYEINAKDRVDDDEYVATESGTLYSWTVGTTLEDEYEGKITVDSAKFNYNYVDLTVTVVDNAENVTTETYEFAIDITAPTVEISYNMNKPVDEANDLGYFNCQRVATITYTERSENWNSDDAEQVLDEKGNVVSQMVTALDINGNPVDGAYTIEWEDIEGAKSDEDTHIATVSFNPTNILETEEIEEVENTEDVTESDETTESADSTESTEPVTGADARYTLDLSYTDAAGNSIATDENGKLVVDAEGTVYPFNFVIDTVSPEVLSIEYKEKVKDAVINTLTFNYFGANAEVTVTLKDDTAGINEFDYEGLLDSDISDKNKAVILTAVENADIKQQTETDKSEFVVQFTIPKEALTELNSFRGTVRVNAWDYCDNTVQKHDETHLVVDKIAPTCQVTFDQPVNEVEGVSYYDNSFTATIVIDEANFYEEDVEVSINGTRVMPTDWTQTPGTDIWTSHVSFIEENDYILTVNYTDRSGNVMTTYESNQRTLDTTEPVISVSNIKHESANNEETIGFVLTVTDKNMALANVKPQATAVIREGDSSANYTYKTVNIDLGTPAVTTNANGETVYTYTVTNLEIDGYYSLVCTVVDHANHSVSNIGSQSEDNRGVAVETVNFSVNRGGSVFWIETIHNDKYSDTTFNNELNGAYANDEVTVKLHEVNVDRVDELDADDKRTVLTLNDGNDSNTIELVENINGNGNYDRNVRIGEGGWYETIYTLENDQFAKDGTYSLNIITYDKAENSNVNTNMNNEEGTIQFVVDRTNPVITTNVKSKQIIDANEYTVELTIAEVNLDESTLVVKLEGEEVEWTKVSNNTYQFTLDEAQWANFPNLSQDFEITAKDLAGNSAEVYQREDITVTDDVIIQVAAYMINRPVLLGVTGAGVVAIAGFIIFLIVWKKRRKDEA